MSYVANVDLAKLGGGARRPRRRPGLRRGRAGRAAGRAPGCTSPASSPPRTCASASTRAARRRRPAARAWSTGSPTGSRSATARSAPVVTTEVLEHVPDPDAALRELHRVMRPGAVLCFSVPTSFTELLFWRLHPGYAENATHLRIFTKPELRRLIDVGGFDVVALGGTQLPRRAAVDVPRAAAHPVGPHGADPRQRVGDADRRRRLARAPARRVSTPLAERIGNRVWPKSWYVYCRRR